MAAPPTGPTAQPRKAYSKCINEVVKKSLDQKVPPSSFGGTLGGACQAEAAALRDAVIAQELAIGSKRTEAEEMARDEVLDYQLNATEMYSEYFESGTRPG